MNNVTLVGRLTKDPEVRTGKTGTKIVTFTLAVYRTKDDTDFIPITAFDKQADFAEQYFRKGSRVGVIGSINVNHYKDKDGNNQIYTQIVARSVEFCESKKESNISGSDEWVKQGSEKAPWDK